MTNLLKMDILPTTHRRDLPGYEHHDQHNFINEALISQHYDVRVMFGGVGNGVSDDAVAIQEAVDACEAVGGGIVYLAPGRWLIGATIQVPSRVVIRGAGMYTTKLFAPSSFPNQYMFETVTGADVNEYGQSYGIGFESFTIEDRLSANTLLTSSGRSENHHGIHVHDSDWGWVTNVSISDLKGIGFHAGNVAREWLCWNMYVFNCGDGTTGAVTVSSATGDATNTIYFYGCRVTFPQGRGVSVTGTQDGIRLINFTDCQFEGGGAGSGGSYGDTAPYDIVYLGLLRTIMFKGCNFANPGIGYWCINADGSATSNIDRIDIEGCKFNGNAKGGGIRSNRLDSMAIDTCLFEGSTAGQADFYLETVSGLLFIDDTNVFSPNPFAGPGTPVDNYVRGKIGIDQLSYRNYRISTPNGGTVATQQNGATGYFGSASENSVFAMTIPANTLGITDGIRCAVGGYFNFSGGATTVRVRVKVDATTIWDATTASLTLAGERPWNMDFVWRNIGTTALNSLQGSFKVGNNAAPTAGRGAFGVPAAEAEFSADTTIDTTSSRTVTVTVTLGAARDNVVRYGMGEII